MTRAQASLAKRLAACSRGDLRFRRNA